MKRKPAAKGPKAPGYDAVVGHLVGLVQEARRAAARSVNTVMTAVYWEIGRRVVEHEQGGAVRAGYGEGLLSRLSVDLTQKCGRGFSVDNLETARLFYLAYPVLAEKSERASRISRPVKSETVSRKSMAVPRSFALSWSHYVLLVRRVRNAAAREFYELEAMRGGWTVRQLVRQIDSQFYERIALSRNKAALLTKGGRPKAGDATTPEEEIKDPFVLEFLGLKDEYSEAELEQALIVELETLLLEMGGDFTFAGRQRRLRIGTEWYRIDLLFFHRRLRCLVVIDLKLGRFTHADAGQMHLYLNYAREHWMVPGENPPVGLILCTSKDDAVVRYALEGLANKVMATEYRTTLPDERLIAEAVAKSRRQLEARRAARSSRRPR